MNDLSGSDYVHVWADGIHLRMRPQPSCACSCRRACPPMGIKELLALSDGYRESADSWGDLQRNCRHRGMCASVLAVADGRFGRTSRRRGRAARAEIGRRL